MKASVRLRRVSDQTRSGAVPITAALDVWSTPCHPNIATPLGSADRDASPPASQSCRDRTAEPDMEPWPDRTTPGGQTGHPRAISTCLGDVFVATSRVLDEVRIGRVGGTAAPSPGSPGRATCRWPG